MLEFIKDVLRRVRYLGGYLGFTVSPDQTDQSYVRKGVKERLKRNEKNKIKGDVFWSLRLR